MIHIHGDGGHAKVVRDVWRPQQTQFLEGRWAFVAVGDNAARKRETVQYRTQGYRFATLVHPSAYVAGEVGEGSIIMAGAVVQPGAKIGKHVIVNTGATVDHDCIIEDFAHIAPGAHLCGGVHVGEGALVGVGVGVAPCAKIPAWSLVKARRLEICPTK